MVSTVILIGCLGSRATSSWRLHLSSRMVWSMVSMASAIGLNGLSLFLAIKQFSRWDSEVSRNSGHGFWVVPISVDGRLHRRHTDSRSLSQLFVLDAIEAQQSL